MISKRRDITATLNAGAASTAEEAPQQAIDNRVNPQREEVAAMERHYKYTIASLEQKAEREKRLADDQQAKRLKLELEAIKLEES